MHYVLYQGTQWRSIKSAEKCSSCLAIKGNPIRESASNGGLQHSKCKSQLMSFLFCHMIALMQHDQQPKSHHKPVI